ncbi:arf-GAP with Rho-GAP domain, ANK repeat and PH domain-containing protein 3 [Periophthalmus magnuspinnatus]|uniref:arf-GAP with Rho-GAP domain, ANK repeat and PH domain-containing protein 3 n=1 Tax=Periophthalmus magnuspinnatus TaxID=409849 RepID=UPI00243692CA|nr:arf-GAP with Rho-GAP domain, ANK repeat and PH domain-containing protein 3 [Periophthalmus magnuspinnatus]
MLVAMETLDQSSISTSESSETTEVETLLSSIHLDRYVEIFVKAGLVCASDLLFLDQDSLLSLGITATGHRKRILRLIGHLQRTYCPQPTNQSTPMLDSKDPRRLGLKPVPKPRTVFNRRRTTPVHFAPSSHDQHKPLRRLSPQSLSLDSENLPSNSSVTSHSMTSDCETPPGDKSSTHRNRSMSDASAFVPPVPPRIRRSFTTFSAPPVKENVLPITTSSPTVSPTDIPESSVSPTGNKKHIKSRPSRSRSLTDVLPPIPPRQNRSNKKQEETLDSNWTEGSDAMEMVSNEIYWGATLSGRGYSQQAPPTPPRLPTERSQERNSSSTLSNNSSTSTRASTDDPEEEISPYCETVFSRRTPLPDQVDRSRDQGGSPHTDPESPQSLWLKRLSPHEALPPHLDDDIISPYASYTSLNDKAPPVLSGWLDKLSPQGNYVFQKRFVKFDGQNLMYYGHEKDAYPKGVIPLAVIQMARPSKDNKFEIVTSNRIFVFRADNEVLRSRWVRTLQDFIREQLVFVRRRFGPGLHCQKHGPLETKGHKSKVYTAIYGDQIWIHKNQQCFRNGIAVTVIEARGATIRDGKHKGFDLITPYKTFSFIAESEREKREWTEALQEAISETLSDYEVAEKIWSNKSNRVCADCRALNPDWASINLCVVICKNCAGQHRSLGTSVSKVQSLKLDTSVWSNQIVQLFIMLGNDRANEFWASRLPSSEELDCDAAPELRREFISLKYREGRWRSPHPIFSSQPQLLKVLCSAVSEQTLLKTVTQIFSEAESARLASDANGSHGNSSFTDQAPPSDPGVYDEIMQPVLHSGFLYKSSSAHRGTLSRRTRDDFQRFWCSVDRSLVLFETEMSPDPVLNINYRDLLCLGVSRPDGSKRRSNGFIDRFRYTFELYLSSEKLLQFGLETADELHSWTKAIGKAFTPLSCHCLLSREFERVGVLRYRAMLDPQQWRDAFFVLQKSNLFICPSTDGAAEDIINLRRLQELSVSSEGEGEKKDTLVLVERGRTLHLQGVARTDFSLWCADIQRASGGRGNSLREQQLSRNDIPIIVDSCIAFITQYGLGHEGIYRKNGAKSRIKLLMDEFRKDARNVKLRIGDHFIEDVTDVLKRFFREIDDPIFMSDLHPLWQEAAKIPQKSQRLDRYKEIIRSLPRVNRTTLAALISHLYRVQKCADLNHMCTKNLSLLFAPSLFQTDGKGEHEVKIVEDLIDNYLYVFDIDEEHQTQMDLEISLITSWKDTQLSQAGDLIIEVYLEMKIPDCCITLKVSPTMCAEELTNQVLYLRNVPPSDRDVWMTFEAIEDGQLERPLHPKERVLEQALQWCNMADPSSAFLIVKKVPKEDAINIFTSYKSEVMKVGLLRCREEPPKLLQGNKFQERTFQIQGNKLRLLKDKKSIKPEKEWSLKSMKIYIGIRKKLKAPSRWGFTVISHKHQLFLCCSGEAELWDWITCFLKAQNNEAAPAILRRHSSSDISKQKFGTMPLVPIRGDESNSSMLSANQTLRKLHDRRTLSMYFPMTAQPEEDPVPEPDSFGEPLYEEVGDFGLQVLQSLQTSFRTSIAAETQEVPAHSHLHLLATETGSCQVIADEQLDSLSSPSSEELLLKELQTALGKSVEEEQAPEDQQTPEQRTVEEEERPYDV